MAGARSCYRPVAAHRSPAGPRARAPGTGTLPAWELVLAAKGEVSRGGQAAVRHLEGQGPLVLHPGGPSARGSPSHAREAHPQAGQEGEGRREGGGSERAGLTDSAAQGRPPRLPTAVIPDEATAPSASRQAYCKRNHSLVRSADGLPITAFPGKASGRQQTL